MYSVYVYILVMAVVTYLIRMIPLALLKKEITNTWVKSFLYYVPYVTLAVMTFPAILEATGSLISGAAAFAVAVFMAYRGQSLIKVAAAACAAVFCRSFCGGIYGVCEQRGREIFMRRQASPWSSNSSWP